MTLDELAKLVRKTAKELDLTLDKLCVFHGDRTMDFRSKKQQPKNPVQPHVYCELVNGMKVNSMEFQPGVDEKTVCLTITEAAIRVGLRRRSPAEVNN